MDETLPLFPLNTVLFPGAPLTLHVFEERYRLMIGNCLAESRPFGVVFLHDRDETSGTMLPHTIGTVAQINANVRLEDGRYLIATIGQQRFQIRDTIQRVPYLVTSVSFLPEDDEIVLNEYVSELRVIYDQYWRSVAVATGSQSQVDQLPDDVIAMTYALAHRMQVTNDRKQHWLETDIHTRIQEITAMLQAEMSLLPRPGSHLVPGETTWPWSWN
jgi:hypothetical protein